MFPNGKAVIASPKSKIIIIGGFLIFFFALFSYMSSNQANWFRVSSSVKSMAFMPKIGRGDAEQCSQIFDQTLESLTSAYRRCLLAKMEKKSKWNELHVAVQACLGETFWNVMDVHFLNNWDDVKLVILPQSIKGNLNNLTAKSTGFDCVEVTLGVGKDIEAEKKLRSLVPFCRFYGADPILESGKPFKEMGSYYEVAVAANAGVLKASVLENGAYRDKNVPTVTFTDFITNYTKIDHIDYLFMDNEGAEYGLFEQLKNGGAIEQSNISICQISVEMHGPLASYGMDNAKFDTLITQTIQNSSFLPIWSAPPSYHIRSFYINVHDEYCVRTFFKSKFCDKKL